MESDQSKLPSHGISYRSVTELAVASVTAGLTAGTFVLAARKIADVGDLLGFAGAFVGAVMTIGGAIWVERHRINGAEEKDRQFLTDCIRRIEELASLNTLWVKNLSEEEVTFLNVNAISFVTQIRSSFSEALVIEKSIQSYGIAKAKWSVRATVNLNWLKDRTEEGFNAANDESHSWNNMYKDKDLVKKYISKVEWSSRTMLVLAWRLLLVLGENPNQLDKSKNPFDPDDIVYRHKAGLDF